MGRLMGGKGRTLCSSDPLKDRQGVSGPAKHRSQTFSNPVFKITMIYQSS